MTDPPVQPRRAARHCPPASSRAVFRDFGLQWPAGTHAAVPRGTPGTPGPAWVPRARQISSAPAPCPGDAGGGPKREIT